MAQRSLRSIMATNFPNGIEEGFNIMALRETLTDLSVLHSQGQVRGGAISAGHIFLRETPEIKIGFFDPSQDSNSSTSHHQDQQRSPHLPSGMDDAPEVFQEQHQPSQASDVWLIGITALELAYGGLRFRRREDVDSMIKRITSSKRLPRREHMRNYKGGFYSWVRDKYDLIRHKWVFSKQFERMVARCLAWNPLRRPSVAELLESEIFAKCENEVGQFLSLLKKD